MKKFFLFAVLVSLFVFALTVGAEPSSYQSSIQIQNLDTGNAATIGIEFYNAAGTAITHNDTVAAGGSKTYFPLPAVSAGFDGSAVISSDKPVAAIVNVVADGFLFGASYGGFNQGAPSVNLPLIMKGNSGFNTWFKVQNASTTAATVKVSYAGTSCTETGTIQPGAAAKFVQSTNACLGTKYVGAATVSVVKADGTVDTAGSIVATVMEVGASTLFSYNGFAGAGSTNVVIPLVNSNNANYITGIQLQNVGNAPTTVTLSYTPVAGTACTETQTIANGSSATFALGAFSANDSNATNNCANGAKFVGSAAVTTNSANQPLVGVVNQLNLGANKASAYNAFDPMNAENAVVMPLIMDRNGGFYTGINVMNVGTVATGVTCTYVRSSDNMTVKTENYNLAPNAAFNQLHNNYLGDKFVGGATCTATTTGGKLIAQVNELGGGAGDQLFTYEGFRATKTNP